MKLVIFERNDKEKWLVFDKKNKKEYTKSAMVIGYSCECKQLTDKQFKFRLSQMKKDKNYKNVSRKYWFKEFKYMGTNRW